MFKRVTTRLAFVAAISLLSLDPAMAGPVDWSSTTLSGTFPSFTFVHSELGDVSVLYSDGAEKFGIDSDFAEATLVLGNTGGESLTIAWSNPVSNLDIELWDVDAISGSSGETLTIATAADISPISLHSTDVWNSSANTLVSDGNANANSLADNFSLMNLSHSTGFSSVTFDWSVSGGTGTVGIGTMVIPEPATLALLGFGLTVLLLVRNRWSPLADATMSGKPTDAGSDRLKREGRSALRPPRSG